MKTLIWLFEGSGWQTACFVAFFALGIVLPFLVGNSA